MTDQLDDRRYREIWRRMNALVSAAAPGIALLVTLSLWGQWTAMAIAIAGQVAIVGVNLFANYALVPRFGAALEVPRSICNSIATAAVYHWIGWPLPGWFWLPFVALTVDDFGGKRGWLGLVVLCAAFTWLSIADGVAPTYGASFSCLAVMCKLIAAQRTSIIRKMLVDSDDARAALARAHQELQAEVFARERAEIELRAAQKLEALGRLAAGVAHEINTPLQFVGDSLSFISSGVDDLLANAPDLDREYLEENLPSAIARTSDGIQRVTAIVRSLKQFAHPGATGMGDVDVNGLVRDTLTISRHEYKLVADVALELGEVPILHGHATELGQVLLNLVVNASHAIGDVVVATDARGRITVATRCEDGHLMIDVADTGGGIPEAIRSKIFEPFFTTKEPGRGTGQGLAIARAIIERHRGRLTFTSVEGVGTTFTIRLPLETAAVREAA